MAFYQAGTANALLTLQQRADLAQMQSYVEPNSAGRKKQSLRGDARERPQPDRPRGLGASGTSEIYDLIAIPLGALAS
jgi:hypothetical protein